jgi:hypothetical protein
VTVSQRIRIKAKLRQEPDAEKLAFALLRLLEARQQRDQPRRVKSKGGDARAEPAA